MRQDLDHWCIIISSLLRLLKVFFTYFKNCGNMDVQPLRSCFKVKYNSNVDTVFGSTINDAILLFIEYTKRKKKKQYLATIKQLKFFQMIYKYVCLFRSFCLLLANFAWWKSSFVFEPIALAVYFFSWIGTLVTSQTNHTH